MYCPNCGTKCEDTHHFCFKCGFQLPQIPESEPSLEVIPVKESVIAEETAEIAAETPVEESSETPVEESSEAPIEESAEAPVEETTGETAQTIAPASMEIPAAAPPKKGRLWPPMLVLGIMMALGLAIYFLFSSNPSDTPDPVEGTPWFSVTDGVLSFDAALYTGGSELEIPETIDGETVTVIGKDCFKDCTELTSVILPNTLTEIDDRAFSGCTGLRGIFIPEGVKRIGNSAFADCASLEAIHLPASITTIADRALFRCPKLAHIFYAGKHENWQGLYSGSMPNNTWVYCEDGNYPYTRD